MLGCDGTPTTAGHRPPSKDTAVTNHPEIAAIVAEIGHRFDALSVRRDRALVVGRQVVRLSANAIRAAHRGDRADAQVLIGQAGTLVRELTEDLAETPALWWAGYVQDALKEYAEASITYAVINGDPIPDAAGLGVEDGAYLNGMAEAASELRRDVLDLLRNAEHDRAAVLLATMDEIYDALVTIDVPDAITGGLRRTTDQLRAVLERTRGDLTLTAQQRRLELALRAETTSRGART